MTDRERIDAALEIAMHYGQIDGDHHKAWVIDQMVRALTACPMVERVNPHGAYGPITVTVQGESDEYLQWVRDACDGEDGPETYDWDVGIAP